MVVGFKVFPGFPLGLGKHVLDRGPVRSPPLEPVSILCVLLSQLAHRLACISVELVVAQHAQVVRLKRTQAHALLEFGLWVDNADLGSQVELVCFIF